MTIEAAAAWARTRPARRLYGRLLLVMLIRSGTLTLRHAGRTDGKTDRNLSDSLVFGLAALFWCHGSKCPFFCAARAVSGGLVQKPACRAVDFICRHGLTKQDLLIR